MGGKRLVLVAGAQDLARDPLALAWYDRVLQVLALDLRRCEAAAIITAGSPGPEVHAEMIALTFGLTAVAYLPSGARRLNGYPHGTWTSERLSSGGAAVVRRDQALLRRAEQARADGHAVEVLAFLEAGASSRSSSLTRTRLAEEAGLPVRRMVWGEAPRMAEAAE